LRLTGQACAAGHHVHQVGQYRRYGKRAAFAARHGLGRLDAWRPLAGGMVHSVLLPNERAVLRVNVRGREAPRVAKEAWVRDHVARVAGPRGRYHSA
jgi:hypothetical protein